MYTNKNPNELYLHSVSKYRSAGYIHTYQDKSTERHLNKW